MDWTLLTTGIRCQPNVIHPMRRPFNARWTVCLAVWLGLAGMATAAPITSDELQDKDTGSAEQADVSSPRSSRSTGVPATAGVQQSKVVELLLEMQDQPKPLSDAQASKDKPSSRARPGTRPAAAPGEAPADGSAADPTVASKLKDVFGADTQSKSGDAQRRDPANMAADGTSRSSEGTYRPHLQGSGESRGSLLANPVVRFIRENRVLTIMVSLAVLAGIWFTSAYSMRSSHGGRR
jgi:hypothetical protein